ncbi:uncharacterized protein PGTG_19926 [Puccinia graminis f. sp. tritici CRL 75-36-700-3]|uniref:Uncharacterized protein n=1 Tax=Puccinia graminis f. sp. tritici (strain CRL 75-36-700-3 / race SCCL) TaxID=418459 RepID=E3LBH3_PUCGT|nr:uncharacterized protein PGTG_19926 [Puccinia graminis f. sp. tritici CRL 75-36-700-3]EFP93898.1 hypothetical protein PGTG_19926 [Puccinia graminis f. sp. tritici CRL 75-36-700-3]
MSPIIINQIVNLENLKLTFVRPQAFYQTSPDKSPAPLITAKTVVILIDIIIVAIICILILLGYFLYRRQLRRKENLTKSFETSEAKIASESNHPAMDSHSLCSSTTERKEESIYEV